MVGLFATLRNTSRVSELGRSMGDQIAVSSGSPPATRMYPFRRNADRLSRCFIARQPARAKAGKGERYELAPAAPKSKQFDRLEQFAKLQNPPSVNFSTSGPMIIHTAGLTLTTRDFDQARVRLDEIPKRHRGYLGDLNVNSPTGSGRSFTATLRVPADQLDAMLAELRQLGRVESESQGGQEVTSEYVDLEARLANSRNTEQRLTDLLRQRTW